MMIRTHYYQQFDADYTRDVPEEGFGGWQETEVEINPAQTALVVMHAWDCGTYAQYPGWFRACPEIPQTYKVCRTVFPPLLAAVRKSPLQLFHVVGGSGYYESYPGYQRALALTPPEPPVASCEPSPAFEQWRRFCNDRVFMGAHNQQDASEGWRNVKFPKEAEPQGDEGIARNGQQLLALCREAGVTHLIYAGFNVDWCLLMSPGGMLEMSRHGLVCSVVRDATTAVENHESARLGLHKATGLWRVSVAFGYVFDSGDLVGGLGYG